MQCAWEIRFLGEIIPGSYAHPERSVKIRCEVAGPLNEQPVAVLRAAEPKRRKLSEIVAPLSEQSTATIDPDFAADVQTFIDRHRNPLHPPEWDSRRWESWTQRF